jgi:tRNA(adenine34) deaminase
MESPFQKLCSSQLRKDDAFFMTYANNEAIEGYREDGIPIGAVIVEKKHINASAHNRVAALKDLTAHADVRAITQAAQKICDWRFHEIRLYVTKEPCPMCSGAATMSCIGEVIYEFSDPKMGCFGNAISLFELPEIGHHPVIKGIYEKIHALTSWAIFLKPGGKIQARYFANLELTISHTIN